MRRVSFVMAPVMNARILFSIFNLVLALSCVLVGEWVSDVETRTHTDKIVYSIVSPMVALAMSNRIYLNFFRGENFSHFPRFLLIGFVTVAVACAGSFIALTFVQPMGIVTGILLATTVVINQFVFVGILYIPLLAILSCLMFNFR